MYRQIIILLSILLMGCSTENEAQESNPVVNKGKTLIVYYSYTGNCSAIVNTMTKQLEADVLEVQPAEKGLKYEANNYALGTQLLNAIKANPNDGNSYPAIDPVQTSLDSYQNVIIVTPLWWSQMAAIMQSYLFQNASKLSGKNVALVVSSHSSGISGVVADAKRLLPDVTWMGDALWINNSNRSNTATLLQDWLKKLNFKQSNMETQTMNLTIDGKVQAVTLVDNAATQALVAKLQEGAVTVTLNTNGDFEIWGSLGFSLPTSNEYINGQPGDVVLYGGSNICIFYGSNSYSYTRLGKIAGLSADELKAFLKGGQSNISVTLSLPVSSVSAHHVNDSKEKDVLYSLNGQRVDSPSRGIYIKKVRKSYYRTSYLPAS